jgi:hypothetical protein
MTDFALGLSILFPGENVSPMTSSGSYDQIAATWRGSSPIPTELEIASAAASYTQPVVTNAVEDLVVLLESKNIITPAERDTIRNKSKTGK